jgi:hypothetical protein
MVSKTFKIAIWSDDRPAWKIARQAEIAATDLYKLMSGATIARPGNIHGNKAIKVGKILGLRPEECFEENSADQEPR